MRETGAGFVVIAQMFMLIGCADLMLIWAAEACHTPSILTPPTGPNTDYPCGVGWYVCANSPPAPNRVCCLEGDECGGVLPNAPQTCPAGECCAGLTIEAKRDAGPRGLYDQRHEDPLRP